LNREILGSFQIILERKEDAYYRSPGPHSKA
jgi:hypothetical protein